MRSGWNGADPPDLPPLRPRERVRLILRGLWSVAALVVLFAVFLVLRGIDHAAARIAGRPVSALGPGVVRLWAAQALPVLGLRFVMHGEPMRTGGAFVANHSSWIDIVALQRAAAPFLVSKAEVRRWPVIGQIGRAIGTMFIDRNPAQAKRQQVQLYDRLRRGDRMAIFPEGTSTDGQRVLPFKSALFGVFYSPEFRNGIAIQPVTIAYQPRADLPPTFYGWWGEMEFASHIRDVLARSTDGIVEVTFHAPLHAADLAGRKELADRACALVRQTLPATFGQRYQRAGSGYLH